MGRAAPFDLFSEHNLWPQNLNVPPDDVRNRVRQMSVDTKSYNCVSRAYIFFFFF